MSGITGAASNPVSEYTLLTANLAITETRLNTLTEQASTGLVAPDFGGLGASAAQTVSLNAQVAEQQALIAGVNNAGATLQLTQTVLTQIGSIAQNFANEAQSLTNADPAAVGDVAAAAQNALTQLAGLLDTQNGGNYLFAGTDTAAPPVPNPDQILTSGFYTQISASVQGLATNGASATIAATIATAASNAAGTSPFSPFLSQPAATVQANLPQVEIGPGQFATVGVAAGTNTAAISTGASTTGSYIRDLMRGLAVLGSLNSNSASASGFQQIVSDTVSTLQNVVGNVADEQGILGATQNELTNAASVLTQSNTALTSQISNLQDVNIAQVSTQLSLTQASLQDSYRLIAGVGTLSLVNYLPAA